jgi:hypothetical protein
MLTHQHDQSEVEFMKSTVTFQLEAQFIKPTVTFQELKVDNRFVHTATI